ncbi:MAG: glycosyltransferase [Alteraurantiacibacter sp.]
MFESVKGLARAQAVQGLQVTVLAGSDPFTDEDRDSWAPLELITVESTGFRNGIRAEAMVSRLDALQPDLAHLHGIWGPAARALARWTGRSATPYVVSPRGMLDHWALRRSGLKKRLSAQLWEGRLLRRAAFIHALAASEGAAVRAYGLSNPMALIPNGITSPQGNAPLTAHSGRRTMLFMARIHPKKGLTELLSAWALLPVALLQGWHLQIAGWDEIGMLDDLRQQAATLGIADAVSFTGGLHGAAKDAALRGASAFILPSYSEGLPMAVLEGWAYGLPVFMTEACNLPEGFAAGAAFRITTDPAQMAQVLAHMLADAPALAAAGKAGRKLAEGQFAWDAIAARMLAHYHRAVEGR